MNIFFASNLYLSHKNILLSYRPCVTLREHDQALIENWNHDVKSNDVAYFLDNLALRHLNHTLEMVSRLRRNKHSIRGNHNLVKRCRPLFKEMAYIAISYVVAPIWAQCIALNHYAMRVWNRSHYDAWRLHGHSHGKLSNDHKILSIDAGVDCHNYTPVSCVQAKEIIS